MRGYAVVALHDPKYPVNVGGAMRAASVFGASLIVIDGNRHGITHATNTSKSWRHIPTLFVDNVFDALPVDCVPVAVEMVPGARSLPGFRRGQNAWG